MAQAFVEHVNFTVADPQKTAALLCDLFDWTIRWEGEAIHEGYTIHVGGEHSYLALYSLGRPAAADDGANYRQVNGLNHIAIVVDDLDGVEARVKAAGLVPGSHADYEPGRRFYFDTEDGIEFEIVSYTD